MAYLGVSPILATLGTMTFIDGVAVLLTRGRVISSGLNLLGVSSHLTIALWGGIIIFIASLNLLRSRNLLKSENLLKRNP